MLTSLKLTDRTDPICDLVARKVIECATGDFDRAIIYDRAMSELTKDKH